MKFLAILFLLTGCTYYAPTYKVGECYSDGIDNYKRVIKINNQYKTAWYYQLYVDGKDVGEYHMSVEETEVNFEFKRDCPK